MDIVLVGDSLGMVVLGYENTLPRHHGEMLHHTRAVRRGVRKALLVADMPYGSYHDRRQRCGAQRGALREGSGRRSGEESKAASAAWN